MSKKKEGFYVVHVKTDSGDDYIYAFKNKVSREDLAKLLWIQEGKCADPTFYEDTLQVDIEKTTFSDAYMKELFKDQ